MRLVRGWMGLAWAVTACADPPSTTESPPAGSIPPLPADLDDDGFDATVDCDDLNPGVFPGAVERCDGVDQDCDGASDEDAVDAVTGWPDVDGDGDGDASAALTTCTLPDTYVGIGGDCNDLDPTQYSGAVELCDGVDNDCDPSTPEDGVVSAAGRAFTSIQDAVDLSPDGSVITVCPGTYTGTIEVGYPHQVLTLVGLEGAEATILDGEGERQILTVNADTVNLEGLSFVNGSGRGWSSGGAVQLSATTVTVTGCVFADNVHRGSGGALSLFGTTATITDSVFRGNQADTLGGGAIAGIFASGTIADSTFEDNHSGYSGGAINLTGAVTVERTTFVGNSADDGGAVDFSGLDLSIVDSTFTGNSATHNGGAVESWWGLAVTGSTFDGNSARDGGGIVSWGEATLDGLTFTNNVATQTGGALLVDADTTIANSAFWTNSANHGGGVGTNASADGTLVSTATDWGVDATDNLPEDVWMEQGDRPFTATGDFTCNLGQGRCE